MKLSPYCPLTGQVSLPVTDIKPDLETFIVLNAVHLLLIIYLSRIDNLLNNASVGSEYIRNTIWGRGGGFNRVFILNKTD